MPVYEYTALDKKEKKRSGFIDAESARQAGKKLSRSGIYPVSLKEVDGPVSKNPKGMVFFQSRIKVSEVSMMTRQLSTLIAAGFPLTTALNTMIPQTKNQSFQRVISKIKDRVEQGTAFAKSLAEYPRIFSDLYVNMIRAGEASGTLDIVLEKLADISEKQYQLNTRLKSAMTYPALMTLIGSGVLLFLLTVIVPNITSIFDDMNQTLPLATRVLIAMSQFMKTWWILILALFIAGYLAYGMARKSPGGRLWMDNTILKLPLVGELIRKTATARFAMTLASLLENGVTLLKALDIVKNIVGNKIIENLISEAAKEVEQGHELGQALGRHDQFPYLAVQMIQIGEQSGNLEPMLKKTATVYENEVETTLTGLTALVEPVIIIIMAVVVGFIVLSICLPIFEMNQLIK